MNKIIKIVCAYSLYTATALCPTLAVAQCVVSGCNGQTCSHEAQPSFGQCTKTLQDQCYAQAGICEEDQNGECNWRSTKALQDCLSQSQQITAPTAIPANQTPRSLPDRNAPCDVTKGSCNNKPYIPPQ